MIFWVGITDDDWFEYLSSIKPDEVNFWQPGSTPPKKMKPGTLFLFKLHSPRNYIVGGGFFVRFTTLPLFLAWEALEQKNGVKDYSSFIKIISTHRKKRKESTNSGTNIGCNILTQPFFFSEQEWIPIPGNFKLSVQRGKTYDTNEQYGVDLWDAVKDRLARIPGMKAEVEDDDYERYGSEYLTRARLGQGSFRILVTDAYHRRCAVTNEKTLPALEAAHIKDYSQSGPHRTNNGLLLRADIHRLFDDGYVTIDPDLKFIVSSRVKEQFENGKEYYRFDGKKLQNLPESLSEMPCEEFIRWHNEQRYERI